MQLLNSGASSSSSSAGGETQQHQSLATVGDKRKAAYDAAADEIQVKKIKYDDLQLD